MLLTWRFLLGKDEIFKNCAHWMNIPSIMWSCTTFSSEPACLWYKLMMIVQDKERSYGLHLQRAPKILMWWIINLYAKTGLIKSNKRLARAKYLSLSRLTCHHSLSILKFSSSCNNLFAGSTPHRVHTYIFQVLLSDFRFCWPHYSRFTGFFFWLGTQTMAP